jgi:hypothetical protein
MPTRSSSAALRLAATLLTVSSLGEFGCAAPVRRGEAPSPPPAAAPAGDARAGAPGRTRDAEAGPVPGRSGAKAAPGRLDPSEEITPEELASIPDPVPTPPTRASASGAPSGANVGLKGSPVPPMDRAAPAGSETPSGPAGGASPAQDSAWYWRVQVFASENAAEAERVAREAESRLGEVAAVVHEGSLYKVRLGRFATESGARPLRDRAVDAGYRGAFRTKTR